MSRFPSSVPSRTFGVRSTTSVHSTRAIRVNCARVSKLMCREIQMGVSAAQRALLHAGLQPGSYPPHRFGVSFGSDHIVAAPAEFEAAFRACVDADERVLDEWGRLGMSANHAAVAPEVSTEHARQSRGHLERSAWPEQFHSRSARCQVSWPSGRRPPRFGRGAADLMLVGATGSSLQSGPFAADLLLGGNRPRWRSGSGGGMSTIRRPAMRHGAGRRQCSGHPRGGIASAGTRGHGVRPRLGAWIVVRRIAGSARHSRRRRPRRPFRGAERIRNVAPTIGHLNPHGLATRRGTWKNVRDC